MSTWHMTRGSIGFIGVLIVMCGQVPALHADTQPPEGAVTAALRFPPVGATWSYKVWARGPTSDQDTKRTAREGTVVTKIHTIMAELTHDGKAVYPMRDGTWMSLMDKGTGNSIAFVREHKDFTYDKTQDDVVMSVSPGDPVFSFSPYIAVYEFPLWVGKSWQTPYIFYNHQEEKGTSRVWRGKVSAHEDVTVPAGTFKTFKVEGTDGVFKLVHWYAPELNIAVKTIFEQEFEMRISELTKYDAK